MSRAITLVTTLALLGVAQADPEPAFSFRVTGCAETNKGMASATRGAQQTIAPKIELTRSGIRYSRAGTHQCCRKVEVRRQVQIDKITLTEYWTGEGCRCLCYSQIEATLTNVVAGEYTVTVFSAGIQPGTHKAIEPVEIFSAKVKVP